MPRPSSILRLIGFAVAAGLAMAGVQPVVAASAGAVGMTWAIRLTTPAVTVAVLVFIAARLINRGDALQPPWYSAWLVLPGAFLLAGAAAMCIFGAFVEVALIPPALSSLLISGASLWILALVLVRRRSR
ncbi:MAG TPA: hypothetical protein VKE27_12535 [Candidatus Dormibacteraeota bacterium]|nr:hypothetical protein [Candidatus Dormibacteraeota bacterium]